MSGKWSGGGPVEGSAGGSVGGSGGAAGGSLEGSAEGSSGASAGGSAEASAAGSSGGSTGRSVRGSAGGSAGGSTGGSTGGLAGGPAGVSKFSGSSAVSPGFSIVADGSCEVNSRLNSLMLFSVKKNGLIACAIATMPNAEARRRGFFGFNMTSPGLFPANLVR